MLLQSSQPRRSKRFINNVVFPHSDLPIIKPQMPFGSSGRLHCFLRFSFKARFSTSIFYIYIFLNLSLYLKNVLFQVSTYNRNRKYHCCCVQKQQINEALRVDKLTLNFLERNCWGKFSKFFSEQTPFEMPLPGHNFTGPGTKRNKRLKLDGKQKSGVCL